MPRKKVEKSRVSHSVYVQSFVQTVGLPILQLLHRISTFCPATPYRKFFRCVLYHVCSNRSTNLTSITSHVHHNSHFLHPQFLWTQYTLALKLRTHQETRKEA